MTYGSKQGNNTVSSQWQWFSGPKTTLSAKYLGFWTKDKPYLPADHPDRPVNPAGEHPHHPPAVADGRSGK